MKKIKILLLILFIGISQFANSQTIDSLKQVLETVTIDSVKLELNQKIGNQYEAASKYDSASTFYQNAYSLAKKQNNKYKQSELLNRKATMLYWTSFYAEADSLFQKSLKIAIELNDSTLSTSSYNSLASNCLRLKDTLLAITYLNKALDFCPTKNKTLKGRTYANLGQLNRGLKDLDAALNYFQLSEDIWKELKMTNFVARIQFEKAQVFYFQKKYRKSIMMNDIINRLKDRFEITDILNQRKDLSFITVKKSSS